jgi:hypothetical protein
MDDDKNDRLLSPSVWIWRRLLTMYLKCQSAAKISLVCGQLFLDPRQVGFELVENIRKGLLLSV